MLKLGNKLRYNLQLTWIGKSFCFLLYIVQFMYLCNKPIFVSFFYICIHDFRRYLSPDGRFCSSRIEALKYMLKENIFKVNFRRHPVNKSINNIQIYNQTTTWIPLLWTLCVCQQTAFCSFVRLCCLDILNGIQLLNL